MIMRGLIFAILLSMVSCRLAVVVRAAPDIRITVVFVKPQHFTDVKYTKAQHHAAALLAELQQFIQKIGERYVPTGLQLELSITDIDLSGAFEPWRGLQFDHVRIIRDIYPPRIALEFRLTDASGQAVRPLGGSI